MPTPKTAVILRRVPGTDPTHADAIDALISVTHCGIVFPPVGEATMGGGGTMHGLSAYRARVDIDCVGFVRDAGSAEPAYTQSVGRLHRLTQRVLVGPVGSTLWLWRVLASGTDTNTPAPRDHWDATDEETDDYTDGNLWHLSSETYLTGIEDTYPTDPAGLLPLRVVMIEGAEPSHDGGGRYSFSFTLWAASYTVVS